MSSFICSEKDFERITKLVVRGLDLYRYNADEFRCGIKEDLEDAFGISKVDIETDADYRKAIQDVYKAVKKLNYDAVYERYKKGFKINFREIKPFWFTGRITHQDYKTLQCYLYQCCEGEVPETKLYKALRKLQSRVAMYIVEQQPEYAEAQWGESDWEEE